ncbi:glycosyltransferase, partial [bacterium]|nr:glycosyltransferase [bacterium]
ADLINAVSPGYAKEILTPEFGCGLQDFLKTRQNALTGILNGLDQVDWDPMTDTTIINRYDRTDLRQKSSNKAALQAEFELPIDSEMPLLVMITRMDQQKGVDIAIEGLRLAADLNWQAIILGTGDPLLETSCRSLESEFPDRVRASIRFDVSLSRRMYAGGDILLMPSRYEPCGLAQMIAIRYGTIPLARATGGLRDTITDDPTMAKSTGFLFEDARPEAFAESLRRAIYAFPDREIWSQIQMRGMAQDFSWEKSAMEYTELYTKLAGR